MSLTKILPAELFPARESLASDIQDGDGKIDNFFYSVAQSTSVEHKGENFVAQNRYKNGPLIYLLSLFWKGLHKGQHAWVRLSQVVTILKTVWNADAHAVKDRRQANS